MRRRTYSLARHVLPLVGTCLMAVPWQSLAERDEGRVHDELMEARYHYDAAECNLDVLRYASRHLNRARDSLREAERLWNEHADAGEIEHYTYLAQREAEIAQQKAVLVAAQAALTEESESQRRFAYK